MKRKKMHIILISMLVITSLSTSMVFANTDSNSISNMYSIGITNESDMKISGEQVVGAFIEDGQLVFVTFAEPQIAPGGGKCPEPQKTIITKMTKGDLIALRDRRNLENGIRTYIASTLASFMGINIDSVSSIISPFIPSVAKQCQRILDNNDIAYGKTISIKATFRCSEKVQSGSWFHYYTLIRIEA